MKTFFTACVFVWICSLGLSALPVSVENATKGALHFISCEKKLNHCQIVDFQHITVGGETVAYAFNLSPMGYIVMSSSYYLPPVIAFSTESGFGELGEHNPLYTLIVSDLPLRMKYSSDIEAGYARENILQWEALLNQNPRSKGEPQQWPEGQEGWIQSSWNQNAPYWNMCPVDPVTHVRCYTGCPATAMAMIMDFHATTNNVQFTDEDDYYHSYAGRNYWIDDDFEANGFPSFPDLNKYLDTLNMHYQLKSVITSNDKAALSFACGIAAHQVYTSQGSGTFAVSQAYDAYMRFGCITAVLMYPEEEGVFDSIILNIQHALPVHLAVVDESNSSGHNLVIDGYRTDNYFHLDYGYGEYYNGWYLIPSEIQMGLTVIEGVIVNIMKQNTSGIYFPIAEQSNIEVFPVPANDFCNIQCCKLSDGNAKIAVCNGFGAEILKTSVDMFDSENRLRIDTGSLPEGMYFVKINSGAETKTAKIIVIH
ncbi:MAG TPA: C10 family peptidase [Bacteroidales bacterium]|nr:C10 family peptidase [Bacteroidales bacterium]